LQMRCLMTSSGAFELGTADPRLSGWADCLLRRSWRCHDVMYVASACQVRLQVSRSDKKGGAYVLLASGVDDAL
jgi:hypothetical protein